MKGRMKKIVDTMFIGFMTAWAALSALALIISAILTTLFIYLNGLTGFLLVMATAFSLIACASFLFLLGSVVKKYLGL